MIISDPIAAVLGEWSSPLTAESVLFRLFLSLVLSFIVGCERSSKRHSAGLRTFMLTSFTSSSAAILDQLIAVEIPLLSAVAVVSVALISVNSLLFSSRSQIKGLTTSVSLWATVFMGISSGFGFYTTTIIIFIFLIAIIALFPSFERFLKNRSNHFEVHLELNKRENFKDFVSVCRSLGLRIDDIENNPSYIGSGLSVYTITLTIISKELKKFKTHSEIIKALSTLDYIYHIEELV